MTISRARRITERRTPANKTYYFVNDGVDPDLIYGSGDPVCFDRGEVDRLSGEWGCDLMKEMHEASEEEIKLYGKYDS